MPFVLLFTKGKRTFTVEINSDEFLLGVEANIFVQRPFEIFIFKTSGYNIDSMDCVSGKTDLC